MPKVALLGRLNTPPGQFQATLAEAKNRNFILYFTILFAHPMFYVLRGPRWPQDGHKMAKERPKIPKRAPETPLETSQDDPKVGTYIGLGHVSAILGRLGAILGMLGRLGGYLGPSWGPLGASWGRLGAVLGPSWAVLGASWRASGPSWGPSWAVLGASWGVLGPSCRLGPILGRLGSRLGPSRGSRGAF